MEFKEVINKRRSIRHFNGKTLNDATIKEILESAIIAPSAKNKQPWHFIVIKDQLLKKEIGDMLEHKSNIDTKLTCDVIRECQSLVLVFGKIEDNIMDVVSIGAAIENMILEATNLGVGSLWIGFIRQIEQELKEKFKNDDTLISAVALGYFDTLPNPRPRKTLEEVSKWY